MSAPDNSPTELKSPIGVVSRRTGLKPDLIRAWERRYGAIEPDRSATRRRLYGEDEIQRLLLLKKVVDGGHSIGRVATLPNRQLEEIAAAVEPAAPATEETAAEAGGESAAVILERCLAAVERFDDDALERELERAAVSLGQFQLLEKLLAPMMATIGERWREGRLRPAHEHLTSAAVRSFVGALGRAGRVSAAAPRLVVTTPAGQLHDIGALLVAATASFEGWNVTYLGADLPAEEIAAAVRQTGARAVALSLTYPPDDALLPEELRRLARLLPEEVALLVGGRATASYAEALPESAVRLADLATLRRQLEALRASG